jgi:hypothetical protein
MLFSAAGFLTLLVFLDANSKNSQCNQETASGISLADFQAPVRRSDISYLLDLTALDSSCVIVLKNPDANTKKRSENWHERHDEPKKRFYKAHENSHYILFIRNDER